MSVDFHIYIIVHLKDFEKDSADVFSDNSWHLLTFQSWYMLFKIDFIDPIFIYEKCISL